MDKTYTSFCACMGKRVKLGRNHYQIIGPHSNAEEAESQTRIINSYIVKWRKEKETFHYDWIPKAVMYLCSAEAEAEYGWKYTISFSDLQKEFGDIDDHIIHESIFQRKYFKEIDEKLKETYLQHVCNYLQGIEQKSNKWK